jgi:hypothetical protein
MVVLPTLIALLLVLQARQEVNRLAQELTESTRQSDIFRETAEQVRQGGHGSRHSW